MNKPALVRANRAHFHLVTSFGISGIFFPQRLFFGTVNKPVTN
jgi:hypothetical protein